jgi:ABC-2 type transport system permease protein
MKINTHFYFNVFKNLLKIDLQSLREAFLDKVINLSIWVTCTIIIMGYIMPLLGLNPDYGVFQLGGLVGSAGLFEVFPSVMNLVVDYEGDRLISYQLTLPVPSWLIFIKIICNYAINAIVLGIIVVPLGKLILWNQFDLTKISIIPFFLVLIITGIFFGVFTLFISSLVKNMATIENVWMRVLFPLWFFGGFQFSWYVLYQLVPKLAYINLLNPITYIMEGMRATLLGQEGYIHYIYCLVALVFFSILFGVIAIARLKKRLDYV